jgi:hypothetical protein
VGKIKQHQDAVNHRISQSNERIKTSPLQCVDQVLKKYHQMLPILLKGRAQGKNRNPLFKRSARGGSGVRNSLIQHFNLARN